MFGAFEHGARTAYKMVLCLDPDVWLERIEPATNAKTTAARVEKIEVAGNKAPATERHPDRDPTGWVGRIYPLDRSLLSG